MNEYEKYGDYSQQSQSTPTRGANVRTAVAFLLAGIGIGAVTAILLTPKSGRDVRRSIARGYRTTIDGISQKTRNLRERGSNLLGFNRESGT
jgi:gas vesicle protein